ncbi:hypothetical protein Nepgr_026782 [Nepenthes gracilis]|uniref:Uncharacterized protein n=1 Tax=Nepenthes gracilis TaxID=150966 RepID=A0AAD3T903_NEPGR|nr:hypothetical protein Nepgr_026782 [Nepenthes gracilis]
MSIQGFRIGKHSSLGFHSRVQEKSAFSLAFLPLHATILSSMSSAVMFWRRPSSIISGGVPASINLHRVSMKKASLARMDDMGKYFNSSRTCVRELGAVLQPGSMTDILAPSSG